MASKKFRITIEVEHSEDVGHPHDIAQQMAEFTRKQLTERGARQRPPRSTPVHIRVVDTQFVRDTDEAVLTDFIAKRIETGDMDTEDHAKLMARYGLTPPGQFVAEMYERMQPESHTESGLPEPS